MTYRTVPPKWRLIAQLVTLGGTALVGASISITPVKVDPKLSVIENAMSADIWAFMLIGFGTIGLIAESISAAIEKENNTLFWIVSLCHIGCLSLLIAYGTSAFVGLVRTGLWFNFAAPVLALMVSVWHYIYVKRRPVEPRKRPF